MRKDCTGVYRDDLDAIRLDIQLDTLHSSLKENGKNMDILISWSI